MNSPTLKDTPSTSQNLDNPGGLSHINALDGLRGTAILLVAFNHLFWANTQTGNGFFDLISRIREASYIGVNLFFALSGFLITGILLDTVRDPHYFKTFYMRRTLRIFPLYYAFLALALLLTPALQMHWNGWQYYYLTYTANLALWKHDALAIAPFRIVHFWSLNVEEQFYLIWPFLIYQFRNRMTLLRIAIAGCIVVFLIRIGLVLSGAHSANHLVTYSPTFSCADNLLYGCIAAILVRTSWRQQTLQWAPRIFVACASIFVGMFFFFHGFDIANPVVSSIGFSVVGIMSASLVASILTPGSSAARIFNNGLLRFYGRYSYGFYVYHYTIDAILSSALRAWFLTHSPSKALSVTGTAVIVGIISTIVAVLSYHLFEIHFLKLKKLFRYHAPQN